MKLITYKGKVITFPTVTSIQFKGKQKVDRHVFLWILATLLFLPLILGMFFSGTEVYVVEVNGKEYYVDEMQYKVLVNKMMGE